MTALPAMKQDSNQFNQRHGKGPWIVAKLLKEPGHEAKRTDRMRDIGVKRIVD